jgi:hypothetical protein
MNNSKLSFANETLNYLSDQLTFIIEAIYSDIAVGTSIDTDTNTKIQLFLDKLVEVADIQNGYFFYDSSSNIITIQFAFNTKKDYMVMDLCTIDINDIYTILTTYIGLTTYPSSVYDDITTLQNKNKEICRCIEKINAIRTNDKEDIDKSGSGVEGPAGPPGPPGATGPQGATGADGVDGVDIFDASGNLDVSGNICLNGNLHVNTIIPKTGSTIDLSGNLCLCGLSYNAEIIDTSGQIISGSKSLSWIRTSGSGMLEDAPKDGFYKKIVFKDGYFSQIEDGTETIESGSGMWTVPVGVVAICVEVYGAGGGGGSGGSGGQAFGGGGGAYAKKNYNVSGGDQFNYTVGSGGMGGMVSDNNGGNGGNTIWQDLSTSSIVVTAGGGGGGDGYNGFSGGSGGVSTISSGSLDSLENGQNGTQPDGGDAGNVLGNGGNGGTPPSSPPSLYGGGGNGGEAKGGPAANNGIDGADGGIVITLFNFDDAPIPYTITYNTPTETETLTNIGDSACFIYNIDLSGNEMWCKLGVNGLEIDSSGNLCLLKNTIIKGNLCINNTISTTTGNLTFNPSSNVIVKLNNTNLQIQTDNNTTNVGIAFRNSSNTFTARIYRDDQGSNQADLVFAVGSNSSPTNLIEAMRIHHNNQSVEIDNVDINGGTIDDTTIGSTSPSTGEFTELFVDQVKIDGNTISTNTNMNLEIARNNITKLLLTDSVLIPTNIGLGNSSNTFTQLFVDQVKIDGNTISTNTNMDLEIARNNITKLLLTDSVLIPTNIGLGNSSNPFTQLFVDQVKIDGNTISTTGGNLILDPSTDIVDINNIQINGNNRTISTNTNMDLEIARNNITKLRLTNSVLIPTDIGLGNSSYPFTQLFVDQVKINGNTISTTGGNLILGPSTDVVVIPNGTTTLPSLVFSNSQTTGLFQPNNNQIGFSCNEQQKLRLRAGLGPGQIACEITKHTNKSTDTIASNVSTNSQKGDFLLKLQTINTDAFRSAIWYINIDSSTTVGSKHLRFYLDDNGNPITRAYIAGNSNESKLDFTGQHRCNHTDSTIYDNVENYIGMIVVSTGKYSTLTNTTEVLTDKRAITINDSLPIVDFSNINNQKNVFGVISDKEGDEREYKVGAFVSTFEKDPSDNRLYINSVGEGAIWVCDISGNLENGDYITTCIVPGYGCKQDDDILHNYTVAKITMDCDFSLNSNDYICEEFTHNGQTYKKAFVGCTYHCG